MSVMERGRNHLIKLTPDEIWKENQKGVSYNTSIDLYDNTKKSENMYIGNQWEGVIAPDLEKPVINFLHRVVSYFLSMIISDDVGVDISSFNATPERAMQDKIISAQVVEIVESTKMKTKNRECLRNAAVDGDTCLFARFEPSIRTGKELPMMDESGNRMPIEPQGDIVIDVLDNTNVIFGNPYVWDVQEQPYIIINKRTKLSDVKEQAQADGVEGWDTITSDSDTNYYGEDKGSDNDLVTVLIKLWRDRTTGTIHSIKSTKNVILQEEKDLGYFLYPLAWMSWEKVKNSYHGQPAITQGVIFNQIFVNTMWGLFGIHVKKMAFPKTIINGDLIPNWTNKVGEVIKVSGNPNDAIATGFRSPDFSAQALNLVEQTINYTKEFMGASDASLGDVNPENTSAIIALQKSSSAPLELQKLANYQFLEDIIRILVDIMCQDYGIRQVAFDDDEGNSIVTTIDFTQLDYNAMKINVEVGTASYWSEIGQIQTADNLFSKGIITDAITYLESLPDNTIRNKQKIIKQIKKQAMTQIPLNPTNTVG